MSAAPSVGVQTEKKVALWRQAILFMWDHRQSWLRVFVTFAVANVLFKFAMGYVNAPLITAMDIVNSSSDHVQSMNILWAAFKWPMAALFILWMIFFLFQSYFFFVHFFKTSGVSCVLSAKGFGRYVLNIAFVGSIFFVPLLLETVGLIGLFVLVGIVPKISMTAVIIGFAICIVLIAAATFFMIIATGRLYVVLPLSVLSKGIVLKKSWHLTKGKVFRILGNAIMLWFLLYITTALIVLSLSYGLNIEFVTTAADAILFTIQIMMMTVLRIIILRQLEKEKTI